MEVKHEVNGDGYNTEGFFEPVLLRVKGTMVLVGTNGQAERYIVPAVVYSLFISSTFSITGIEVFTVLVYALFLVNWLAGRIELGLSKLFVLPFVLFGAINILSVVVNGNFDELTIALKENYRLLLPICLFPLLQFVNLRRLLLVFSVFIGLISIYGYFQHLWGVDWLRPEGKGLQEMIQFGGDRVFRAKGNYSVSLTYAGVLLIVSPVFAALAWGGFDKKEKKIFGANAILSLIAIVVSFARSGWLGVIFAYSLFVFQLRRRLAITIYVGMIVLFALFLSLHQQGKLKEWFYKPSAPNLVKRVLMTSLKADRERLYLWEAGFLAFKDRPLLGYGNPDKSHIEPYREVVSKRHKNFRFRTSGIQHNVYMQVLYNSGVIGFAAYLFLWWRILSWNISSLWRAPEILQRERRLLFGITAGLVGSMLAGSFENNFLDGEVQVVIFMMFAVALRLGTTFRSQDPKPLL